MNVQYYIHVHEHIIVFLFSLLTVQNEELCQDELFNFLITATGNKVTSYFTTAGQP